MIPVSDCNRMLAATETDCEAHNTQQRLRITYSHFLNLLPHNVRLESFKKAAAVSEEFQLSA
jgi:N12 class adenine-specific DNA methylase